MSLRNHQRQKSDIISKTIHVRRVSRTVSTRKIMSFSVTSIIFNTKERKLGLVSSKSTNSTDALQKATRGLMNRKMSQFTFKGNTVPYKVLAKYNSTKVTLIPAGQGTGVIACKTVSAIAQALGVENLLSKVHGSHNPVNVARATIMAFEQCHPYKYYANKRNKSLDDIFSRYAKS